MYVLICYDVPVGRTERFRKILSRFLIHEQKSVFAGEITQAELLKLHKIIEKATKPGDRLLEILAQNCHNVSVSKLVKIQGSGVLAQTPHNHHTSNASVI